MINSSTVPAHLPESMIASVALLPINKRLILFTRHSLRERSDGNGFASAQLPLTAKGRVLALSWGRWLSGHSGYCMDNYSISSPIQRCVDTASLMQEGAEINQEIINQPLLVEPGSLVIDSDVGTIFKEIGALNFINYFLTNDLKGTKSAYQGGVDILRLLYQHQPNEGRLMLAVSHDTLLSAFLYVMMGVKKIDWNDWPKMMEGVFLWFDDQGNEPTMETVLNFIWRGQLYQTSIQQLRDRATNKC